MPADIDFVAYDKDGSVVLLAEAKSQRGTSEKWAAKFRRNMLAHGVLPPAKYFLIATPERIYVWKNADAQVSERLPEFTLDATKELKPYFDRVRVPASEIGHEAFAFLFLSWLTDIAGSGNGGASVDPAKKWLSDSGLVSSLARARIEMNPVS